MNSKALMNIELKILDPRVSENLPKIATPGSAGADLRALLDTPLVLADSPHPAQKESLW